MHNKRKAVRKSCAVPVEAKTGTDFDQAETLDISRGGIGFRGRHSIPLHKKIAVELEVGPERDPVLAIGRVCWVRQERDSKFYRYGIKFSRVISGAFPKLR